MWNLKRPKPGSPTSPEETSKAKRFLQSAKGHLPKNPFEVYAEQERLLEQFLRVEQSNIQSNENKMGKKGGQKGAGGGGTEAQAQSSTPVEKKKKKSSCSLPART